LCVLAVAQADVIVVS